MDKNKITKNFNLLVDAGHTLNKVIDSLGYNRRAVSQLESVLDNIIEVLENSL